jgi:hypothetical protein
MKKTILILSLCFITHQSYAQNNLPSDLGKPSFFPVTPDLTSKNAQTDNSNSDAKNNNLDKKSDSDKNGINVTLGDVVIENREIEPAGVKKEDIQKFINYYLEASKTFFKTHQDNGTISFVVEVKSNKKNVKPDTDCIKNPSECSITQVTYSFSGEMKEQTTKDFYQYLTEKTSHDDIEIFLGNLDYTGSLHFAFDINVSNPDSENLNNKDSIPSLHKAIPSENSDKSYSI